MEFIVLVRLPFRATFCTCGLARRYCLGNIFENTRDCDQNNPTLTPRAFQKYSRFNNITLSVGWLVGLRKTTFFVFEN